MSEWLPAPDLTPDRSILQTVIVAGILMGSAVVLLAAYFISDPLDFSPLFLVGWAGLGIALYFEKQDRRFRTLAIRPGEAPMLHELSVPEGVLVAVTVTRGAAVIGEDRGAMWVEGGRLLFSGRRMSFALGHDTLSPEPLPVERGEFSLRLNDVDSIGPLGVSITPLYGDRPYAYSLETTLSLWKKGTVATTEPSQLPPFTLSPNAPTLNEIKGRLGGRIGWAIFLMTLATAPMAALFSGSLPTLLVVAATAAWIWFRAPERGELHDRQRIQEVRA